MNNLTIEQKAELMDILLNDSVIKNRIDNILNSKTISTSIDEDNNIHFINNVKDIGVRILSLNEYNKYIINGTCDGSITKNNKSTWNTTQYSGFGYYMIYYSYTPNLYKGLSVLEVSSNTYKVLQNSNYIKDGRGANTFYGTQNTNVNFELVQNNNFNKNYIKSSYTHIFEALGFIYDGTRGVYQYGRLDLNECTLTKNATLYTSSVNGKGYYSSGYGTYNTTINVTCTCNFRPAFQIKDTNKSNNIFY